MPASMMARRPVLACTAGALLEEGPGSVEGAAREDVGPPDAEPGIGQVLHTLRVGPAGVGGPVDGADRRTEDAVGPDPPVGRARPACRPAPRRGCRHPRGRRRSAPGAARVVRDGAAARRRRRRATGASGCGVAVPALARAESTRATGLGRSGHGLSGIGLSGTGLSGTGLGRGRPGGGSRSVLRTGRRHHEGDGGRGGPPSAASRRRCNHAWRPARS